MPSGLLFVSASASSGTAVYLTTIDTRGLERLHSREPEPGFGPGSASPTLGLGSGLGIWVAGEARAVYP